MADVRMIRITLDLNDGTGTPISEPKTEEAIDKNGKTKEGNVLIKSVILNQGYQTAKRLIIQGVDANINRTFALNEDYMGETTYQNAKNIISKVASWSTSIVSSTLAGASMGGIVGAIAVGGLTTVGIGVSEFIGIQAKSSQYFRAINSSNAEMNFARQRAGLYDGSMGTEN